MKKIFSIILIVAVVFNQSCSKKSDRPLPRTNLQSTLIPIRPIFPFPIKRPLVFSICVDSLEGLQTALGKTELIVDSVEFSDGSRVFGGEIVSMSYKVVPGAKSSSIFNSQLSVTYKSGDYLQTHWQEVWTLGCIFSDRGTPPFTNIIFQGHHYLINTCFTWGAPPQEKKGMIVKYLYLR